MIYFRLPIANCRFENASWPGKPIGNRQLKIGNYLTLRSLTIIFFVRLL